MKIVKKSWIFKKFPTISVRDLENYSYDSQQILGACSTCSERLPKNFLGREIKFSGFFLYVLKKMTPKFYKIWPTWPNLKIYKFTTNKLIKYSYKLPTGALRSITNRVKITANHKCKPKFQSAVNTKKTC